MSKTTAKPGHTISGPSLGPDPNPSFKAPFSDKHVEEHPWAYALIEGPPGQFTAVSLEGVTARAVVKLEPNGEPEASARAMGRLNRAVELRTYHKQWGKP